MSRKKLRAKLNRELGRLYKAHALLVAVQYAVDHDADVDVSDALAGIVALVDQSLAGLDKLEAHHACR